MKRFHTAFSRLDDRNAAPLNDPVFSEHFLDTLSRCAHRGVSMDTGASTFFCELRADRARSLARARSLCRHFDRGDKRENSMGEPRLRGGGTIFLYRGTIVNELSSPEEVFASRIRHYEDSFLGFTIYIAARAESNHVPSKVVGHKSEVNCKICAGQVGKTNYNRRDVTFSPGLLCAPLSDTPRLFSETARAD